MRDFTVLVLDEVPDTQHPGAPSSFQIALAPFTESGGLRDGG